MTQHKIIELPYRVEFKKPAEKFFRKHEDVRRDYLDLLEERYNGEHPETVNIKIIQGKKNTYYRMKLGDWRVIYMIVEENIVVINTLMAGSRGDIYKKLGGLKSLL